MDLSAFYVQFKEETADNVRTIADGLLQLERSPEDRATLDGVFRAAHTVKGSARLLGFAPVAALSHAMESLLGAMRAGSVRLSPELNDLLLQANDTLLTLATAASENRTIAVDTTSLITRLEQVAVSGSPPTSVAAQPPAVQRGNASKAPLPSPPVEAVDAVQPGALAASSSPVPDPSAPSSSSVPDASSAISRRRSGPNYEPAPASSAPAPTGLKQRATVRVRVDRLDRLLAVAGELTVGQQADSLHLESLHQVNLLVGRQQQTMQELVSELGAVRLAADVRQTMLHRLTQLRVQSNELGQLLRVQQEAYLRRSTVHAQLVEELEAEVFAARLVPVATIFATLPRATRELARSLDKQVELELQGEATEADRKVLDALGDPLLHMVRNAVDHGLEPAPERVASGKGPVGHLTIAATAEQGQIRIAVSDDGRGMDPVKLRAAAVRKGLLDEQSALTLTDAEALELIFMPGFSMSPIITDVSGRGVGMDVVRSRMVELGGQVIVDSRVGVGTTITLVLPVSLMTSQVLLVEAGKQLWAIPSRSCQSVLRLDQDNLCHVDGQPLVQYEGKTVPVATLADLLELPAGAQSHSSRSHALLVGSVRPIAVLVERLVDEREVVVKPLGPLCGAQPVVTGVAPLPEGGLAVVLSAQGLVNRMRRARVSTTATTRKPVMPRLLIADDSFTTRELLRSILQSAGYHVTTAVDGQDALDKLRADGDFDLVVSDVEMPRMDGFGLTACMRADPSLAHVPVIIVTSLHSDEHKRQGVSVGAQAYIVKSQFDQSNLLAAVREFLGTVS